MSRAVKLTDLPIYRGTPEQQEAHKKAVRDSCIAEGRAARRAGLPKSACPNFVDPDMAVNWTLGWRWEDEELQSNKTK